MHCSENVCAFFFLFILYLVSRVDHPSCLQTPALIPPVTSLISSFERDTKNPASFGSAGPEDLTLPPPPDTSVPACLHAPLRLTFISSLFLAVQQQQGVFMPRRNKDLFPSLFLSLLFFKILFSSVQRCSGGLISALKLYRRQGWLLSLNIRQFMVLKMQGGQYLHFSLLCKKEKKHI